MFAVLDIAEICFGVIAGFFWCCYIADVVAPIYVGVALFTVGITLMLL